MKIKYAQDLLKNFQSLSGEILGAFNSRISGKTLLQTTSGVDGGSRWGEMFKGWSKADEMINDGKIFFINNFHYVSGCEGIGFPYGTTWACNGCYSDGFQADWWAIKVFMDGNAWVCIGEEFKNLQESDCYAYGDTRDEAIENYGKLYA